MGSRPSTRCNITIILRSKCIRGKGENKRIISICRRWAPSSVTIFHTPIQLVTGLVSVSIIFRPHRTCVIIPTASNHQCHGARNQKIDKTISIKLLTLIFRTFTSDIRPSGFSSQVKHQVVLKRQVAVASVILKMAKKREHLWDVTHSLHRNNDTRFKDLKKNQCRLKIDPLAFGFAQNS